MAGLEEAAAAFSADIARESGPSTSTARAPVPKKDITDGPPERLFGNVGDLEVDDESPEQGGGDDLPLGGERKEPEEEPDEEGVEEPDEGADEEPDEDEDDEAGDDDDAELMATQFEVTVDGEQATVSLKEALEGYIRTETFHKRMNEIEEVKKATGEVAKSAIANYQYSVNLANEMVEYLKAMVPPEPNWDEEFKKNPTIAREKQKYYERVRTFQAELAEKLKGGAVENAKANSVQLRDYVEGEARKFDNLNAKFWATDPQKKTKDLQAMRRTALQNGFSEEEINEVYDSRMLNILLKASKYERMMASKPKPINKDTGKRPSGKGGGPARTRANGKSQTNAMKRLSKSGSIEDAAAVMSGIIASERR